MTPTQKEAWVAFTVVIKLFGKPKGSKLQGNSGNNVESVPQAWLLHELKSLFSQLTP